MVVSDFKEENPACGTQSFSLYARGQHDDEFDSAPIFLRYGECKSDLQKQSLMAADCEICKESAKTGEICFCTCPRGYKVAGKYQAAHRFDLEHSQPTDSKALSAHRFYL